MIYSVMSLSFDLIVAVLGEFEDAGLHPDILDRLLYRKDGDEYILFHPHGEARLARNSNLTEVVDNMTIDHLSFPRRVANLQLSEAITLYPEPFRMQMVLEWWFDERGVPPSPEFSAAISCAWLSSRDLDFPDQLGCTGNDVGWFCVEDIVRMFRDNAVVTNGDDVEFPPDPIVVYSAAGPDALPWYTSPSAARSQLPHYLDDGTGKVYSATAPPEAILGMFRVASTDEFVVDPGLLTDLIVVA